MTDPTPCARRQAERLLRCYPKGWRTRYGDEFTELLAADIADRPQPWARTVDVAVGGIMARFAGMGLSGTTVDPSDRSRRSLATFGWAVAVFLSFAASMWSQLDMAQRWAGPAGRATHEAILVMTVAVAVSVAATVSAAVPVGWIAAVTAARRPELGLRRPVGLFLSSAAVLVAGGFLFRHGWPVVGTHPWSRQSVGPGGTAAFLWSSTMAVSAYWVHPSTLVTFPASEIAWMVVSPLAVVLAATGAAGTLRRIELPLQWWRFVAVIARVAVGGLGLFVLGTLIWVVDGTPGPGNTFQAGTVDLVGLAVMSVALAVAATSVRRTPLSPSLPAL